MNYKEFRDKAYDLGFHKTTVQELGNLFVIDMPGKVAFCLRHEWMNYCTTYEQVKRIGFEKSLENMQKIVEELKNEVKE